MNKLKITTIICSILLCGSLSAQTNGKFDAKLVVSGTTDKGGWFAGCIIPDRIHETVSNFQDTTDATGRHEVSYDLTFDGVEAAINECTGRGFPSDGVSIVDGTVYHVKGMNTGTAGSGVDTEIYIIDIPNLPHENTHYIDYDSKGKNMLFPIGIYGEGNSSISQTY